MTQEKKIKRYPAGWPTDKRSKVLERDDVAIIMHPERQPLQYDYDTGAWSPLAAA